MANSQAQVAARFGLYEVTRIAYYAAGQPVGEAVKVRLSAVPGAPFGPATPNGNIEMLIADPDAAQVFLDAPINAQFDLLFSRTAEGVGVGVTS